MRRRFGWFLFALSILGILFTLNYNITGYSVFEAGELQIGIWQVFLFALMIAGVLIASSRISLDAIIVPSGSPERNKDRPARAVDALKNYKVNWYVVSGGKTPSTPKGYKNDAEYLKTQLIERGIPEDRIIVEGGSANSVENILNSYKLMKEKGIKSVGIVSSPGHLDRIAEIIMSYKKKGEIENDFKFCKIGTDETLKEKVYEVPARMLTDYQLKKGTKQLKSEGFLKNLYMKLFGNTK